MNQRALVVSAIVFIAIIIAMFGYAHLKRAELNRPPLVTPSVPVVPDEQERLRINAVHFYSDGVHTVVGDVMMPTPCDLLTAEAAVMESMPETAVISLATVNNDDTCAQVQTLQRFRVDFAASPSASIRATLDGKDVTLNLRDAEPGVVPEKLEDLYFKG